MQRCHLTLLHCKQAETAGRLPSSQLEHTLYLARLSVRLVMTAVIEERRLVDWGDKVWARRYRAIEVSDEPEAQRERLKYILSHGSVSHCTSFQDSVLEFLGERFWVARPGQSLGIS